MGLLPGGYTVIRTRLLVAALVCLLAAGLVLAGDAPVPLALSQGVVDKVEKDSLSLRPRGPDGKFQKTLTLKVTGTSNVTIVTQQKRMGNLVLVQKKAEPRDLQTGQHVAVIYAPDKSGGGTMLSAVAQPAKP